MSALTTFTVICVGIGAAIGEYFDDMALGSLAGLLVVICFVIAAYNPPEK
jgi:hypothetical protein